VAGLELGTKCACTYSHSRCLPSVQVVPLSNLLLCIEKNYSTNMARTRPKLPTAARRDMNTSGIVEEGRSSPDCLDENSSASNVSSSSRDRSPSPEEVFVEDLNLTRSNDPRCASDHDDGGRSGPHKRANSILPLLKDSPLHVPIVGYMSREHRKKECEHQR
jgi:hypothetical protein